MSDLIKTIEYKGYDIEIYPDTYPEDPREWDNLGKIITKRWWNESDINANDTEAVLDFVDKVAKNGGVVLPIYVYSHSGDHFKTSSWHGCGLPQGHARFDSGLAGFIYVTADTIRKEYGKKRISAQLREKVENLLKAEIETVDDYANGNVYGYKLIDPDGEEIDSCWGYYGYDYMIDEVKGQVDYLMQKPATRAPVIELLGA